VILPELLSDNLSDVPEDIFSDSESDSDDSVRERKIVCPKQSYSESQTGSKESDDSNNTSNVEGNYMGKTRQNAQFSTCYWKSRCGTNSL
jgi:hypothetical protein